MHVRDQARLHSALIESAQCPNLQSPLCRLPDRDIGEASGAELGLAVVKKLTERLGVSIAVESAQTAFTLILDQI